MSYFNSSCTPAFTLWYWLACFLFFVLLGNVLDSGLLDAKDRTRRRSEETVQLAHKKKKEKKKEKEEESRKRKRLDREKSRKRKKKRRKHSSSSSSSVSSSDDNGGGRARDQAADMVGPALPAGHAVSPSPSPSRWACLGVLMLYAVFMSLHVSYR